MGPFSLLAWLVWLGMAGWSLFAPKLAVDVYCVGALVIATIIQLQLIVTRPNKSPVPLTPEEMAVYRRHLPAILYPTGAYEIGRVLNIVRMGGLFSLPWVLWNRLWGEAAFMVIFFFTTGHLVVALSPRLYYGDAARKGNMFAMDQLMLLESVEAQLKAWFEAKRA